MQSLARKVGSALLEMQTDINSESFKVLKNYCDLYMQRCEEEDGDGRATELEAKREALESALVELSRLIVSNQDKSMPLLRLCSDVCRVLGGGRVVCCKSAKDRTSMSVTWEMSRLLTLHHNLPSSEQQAIADLLRLQDVRRFNVLKNTGKKGYAFNAFQRSMLPPVLCPPMVSCGNTLS